MSQSEGEARQSEKSPHRGIGCFGWMLVWIGLILLFKNYWFLVWEYVLFSVGLILFYFALSSSDKQHLFPGAILIIVSGSLILRGIGWIHFPLWNIWPILFISAGVSFLLLWIAREAGVWVFIPGGLLLFIGSYGLTENSWWIYQRWLRNIFDLWPGILIILGVFLILRYWRKSRSQDSS